MHDCPACRVPLHGYEEVCPSCGTKQLVRKGFMRFTPFFGQQPKVNWLPFILVFVFFAIVVLCSLPNSWIGELISKGPRQEDPMSKLTYTDARRIIEDGITKGLADINAQGKLSWTDLATNSPADKTIDKPLQLTVDATLPNPTYRKTLIDPIKDYMDKANIPTLVVNDAKTHATWTYNVSKPVVTGDQDSQ